MSIAHNLSKIYSEINPPTRLVAVSKTVTANVIREAYDAGQRLFGENKAQDLSRKAPILPADIEWHFIGHLQRNKVKDVVPSVHMIHSIDSLRLLKEIDAEAARNMKKVKCLLQFHIAAEESKFGLKMEGAEEIITSADYSAMKNIEICGVMGMASFTDDMQFVRSEFSRLRTIFLKLKNKYFTDNQEFCEISMGMTGDYQIAMEEGSTLIRIGTAIFGERK